MQLIKCIMPPEEAGKLQSFVKFCKAMSHLSLKEPTDAITFSTCLNFNIQNLAFPKVNIRKKPHI
jgi:hypothetical protein